jgi:hypothetical protein
VDRNFLTFHAGIIQAAKYGPSGLLAEGVGDRIGIDVNKNASSPLNYVVVISAHKNAMPATRRVEYFPDGRKLPANVVNEGLATTDAKQYSFFFVRN